MRILLVEDDKLIGDGIKAGLSKMGFSIDWFTAGLALISFIVSSSRHTLTERG